ncbi:MAG: hypothetical protein EPN43_06935 [Jatrophihabitans sp.]|nr:MAG: hypothetical protein EPN43_06935 [Jatrophihabitans sp.]
MSWTWVLEDAGGTRLDQPAVAPQPNQADAESWLGENWRQLADGGVAAVRLFDGDVEVYGPMPLSEA